MTPQVCKNMNVFIHINSENIWGFLIWARLWVCAPSMVLRPRPGQVACCAGARIKYWKKWQRSKVNSAAIWVLDSEPMSTPAVNFQWCELSRWSLAHSRHLEAVCWMPWLLSQASGNSVTLAADTDPSCRKQLMTNRLVFPCPCSPLAADVLASAPARWGCQVTWPFQWKTVVPLPVKWELLLILPRELGHLFRAEISCLAALNPSGRYNP